LEIFYIFKAVSLLSMDLIYPAIVRTNRNITASFNSELYVFNFRK